MRPIDHHLKVRSVLLACVILVAAALVSGCSSDSGENKAGNESSAKPVELVLANNEPSSEDVAEWANAVERLSDGSLRIRVSENWRSGEKDYNRATLNDVRRGEVPLAAVKSRAFDEVGVTSFQPFAAPLLIDSLGLERRALTGELAERALEGTEKIDMVGLALMPGELRRPVGLTRTLAGPQDYRGARIYTREGKVAAQTLEALGGQPVHAPTGDWFEGFDGAEIALSGVRNEPEVAREKARVTTNVVLWAQPSAIVMNADAFDKLSDTQQTALREAGKAAFVDHSRANAELRTEDLEVICRIKPTLVEASASDRAALETAVEPVYRTIEKSPGNAEAIAAIRRLKGSTPPDDVDCGGVNEQASSSDSADSKLEGTFRTKLTEDELAKSPFIQDAAEVNDENWGNLTLRLSHGQVRYSQRNDQASFDVAGTYTTDGDVIKMVFDEIGETWGFRWSLYRGTLEFKRDPSLGVPPELHSPTPFLVNPWERVG